MSNVSTSAQGTEANPAAKTLEIPKPLTKAIGSYVSLSEKVEGAFDLVVSETGKFAASNGLTKDDKKVLLAALEEAGLYDPARRSDVLSFVFASDEAKSALAEIAEYNASAPKNKLIGRNQQLRVVRASKDAPVTLQTILDERKAKEEGKSTRAARPPAGTTTPATGNAEEDTEEKSPLSSTATVHVPISELPGMTAASCVIACEPAIKAAFLANVSEEELSEAFMEMIAKYYVAPPEA